MNIYDYITSGGKNLIIEYINNLPNREIETALKRAKGEGLL